jgi:hypothetical protein
MRALSLVRVEIVLAPCVALVWVAKLTRLFARAVCLAVESAREDWDPGRTASAKTLLKVTGVALVLAAGVAAASGWACWVREGSI